MAPKPHYKLKAIWPTAYYHVEEDRAIICATPRAGSTSMLGALEHLPRVSGEQAIGLREEAVRSFMWLRDPLERWASAADLFMRNKGWTLDQFVKRTFEERNPHWMPQTAVHATEAGILVPNVILPFEDLNDTWPRVISNYPLEMKNVTKQRKRWPELAKELTDEQKVDLSVYYGEDLLWREHLSADSDNTT